MITTHINEARRYINGIHDKTILIRTVDDTHIPFPVEEVMILTDDDIDQMLAIYNMFQQYNIVIDSRAKMLVKYAIVYYGYEVLVFNAFRNAVISVHEYCSMELSIGIAELTIPQLQDILRVQLILDHHLKDLHINWSISNAVYHIKHTSSTKSIVHTLINCVGIQDTSEYDMKNVEQIMAVVRNGYLAPRAIGVNRYELYMALTMLYNEDH